MIEGKHLTLNIIEICFMNEIYFVLFIDQIIHVMTIFMNHFSDWRYFYEVGEGSAGFVK